MKITYKDAMPTSHKTQCYNEKEQSVNVVKGGRLTTKSLSVWSLHSSSESFMEHA